MDKQSEIQSSINWSVGETSSPTREYIDKPNLEFRMQNSESKITRLELIVEQIGEAVIATTETVERLAERVDALAVQMQQQVHQVQQQSYQIFAVSDALQTLVDSQSNSKEQLDELTNALNRLVTILKSEVKQ